MTRWKKVLVAASTGATVAVMGPDTLARLPALPDGRLDAGVRHRRGPQRHAAGGGHPGSAGVRRPTWPSRWRSWRRSGAAARGVAKGRARV